ncbi:hypothetical protein V8F20_002492 [Naviculisporaceae sp. PSN 640]
MPLVIPIAVAGEERRIAAIIIKAIAMVVSMYTIGSAAWDICFYGQQQPRRDIANRAGILTHRMPSPLETGPAKRDILKTRILILLAAILTTIRSGAHLAFDFVGSISKSKQQRIRRSQLP